MTSKFLSKLTKILKIIPEGIIFDKNNAKIRLTDGRSLLDISPLNIEIPGVSISSNFFNSPSPLMDNFVLLSQIETFCKYLKLNNLYQRLNHLGFCYAVESIEAEKQRLINEVKKTNWHLYEENSNDGTTWLFMGDRKDWQDPMIELVLVEKTKDKWKDYWLPHFQIDIDTYLNGDEIEKLILEMFKNRVKPYRIIEYNKFIVLVRARLGIISGININLDLGFEGRMTRYHRTKTLKQLV